MGVLKALPDGVAVRIRTLREERGLTKTALAADRYTVSYVSQIEAGRRRPSPRAVAFFADRLGVSEDFLATGVPEGAATRIAFQIEAGLLSARSGEAAAAYERLRPLVGEIDLYGLAHLRGGALLALGESLGRLGRLRESIDRTEEALEESSLSDRERGLGTAALVRMYREVGDLAYAADLAESFLKAERVAPLEPAVSADVHTALVSIYFERGDVLRAERAARRALAAVEHGANPRVRADAMWSASRVLAESQRWDEALDLVRRARVIIDDLGDQSRLTRVHTAYAFLCLESEPPRLDEAAVNLDKAESLMGPEATAEDQAYLHLERARLALLRESYEDAVRLSERAVAHAQDDPLHRGRCLFVRGRALAGAGRPAPAVESFQEAAATFAKQGARRQEASCWREIGELHLASGDLEAGLGSLRAGLEALDPRRSRA